MIHLFKPNKKGFSLTEVLAAVVLLALFTGGILTTIVFARTQISSISTRTAAIAGAQGAADALISALTSGETDTADLETLTGADYVVGPFSYDQNHLIQFKLLSVPIDGNTKYLVQVAAFYGTGGSYVTLSGSAVNTGTIFLGS